MSLNSLFYRPETILQHQQKNLELKARLHCSSGYVLAVWWPWDCCSEWRQAVKSHSSIMKTQTLQLLPQILILRLLTVTNTHLSSHTKFWVNTGPNFAGGYIGIMLWLWPIWEADFRTNDWKCPNSAKIQIKVTLTKSYEAVTTSVVPTYQYICSSCHDNREASSPRQSPSGTVKINSNLFLVGSNWERGAVFWNHSEWAHVCQIKTFLIHLFSLLSWK